jgi:hypothetical protein
MYASVIASASRTGFVLTSAEFVVVAALLWLQGRASGRAVGKSAVRVALLLAVFTIQPTDPFATRREFDVSSTHMIAARPWSGFGLGTWPVVYPAYAIIDNGRFANRAHSDWLEWTVDGGRRAAVWTRDGDPVPVVFASGVWFGLGVDYPFSRPAPAARTVMIDRTARQCGKSRTNRTGPCR